MACNKLTPDAVRLILTDYFCNSMARSAVAKKHGVSQTCVWLISKGKMWKSIWAEFQQDEPTETELERIIAEQSQTLPRWWWRESEKCREEELPVLPAVHARGRGARASSKLELRCGMV